MHTQSGDNDQVSWLEQQINLMESWLSEALASPERNEDNIKKLATHLDWLRQALAKAAA